MEPQQGSPLVALKRRSLMNRISRRICLTIIVLFFSLGAVTRIYVYALTLRAEKVIAGLSRVEIDKTTDYELLQAVPYLVRWQWEGTLKPTAETGDIDSGEEHGYGLVISNEPGWTKIVRFLGPLESCCARSTFTKDGYEQNWVIKLADLIGYRYLYFGASVAMLNGKVSSIRYGVADRLTFPRQVGEILSVESFHSVWAPHGAGFEVPSTQDESPQFRIAGNEHSLSISYAFDAPRDLTAQAFVTDLSCFWELRGCRHVWQIAGGLWEEKHEIESATIGRLRSQAPCPDRILAGRARYLPDASILLLESKGIQMENAMRGNLRVEGRVTKYKLVDALRGSFSRNMESVWETDTVPFPGDYARRLTNTGIKSASKGERVLAFSNLSFDSCGIIPATPSAFMTIKNASVAPRRDEDKLIRGLQ